MANFEPKAKRDSIELRELAREAIIRLGDSPEVKVVKEYIQSLESRNDILDRRVVELDQYAERLFVKSICLEK